MLGSFRNKLNLRRKVSGVTLFSTADRKVLFTTMNDEDVRRGVGDNINPSRIGVQMWWSGFTVYMTSK